MYALDIQGAKSISRAHAVRFVLFDLFFPNELIAIICAFAYSPTETECYLIEYIDALPWWLTRHAMNSLFNTPHSHRFVHNNSNCIYFWITTSGLVVCHMKYTWITFWKHETFELNAMKSKFFSIAYASVAVLTNQPTHQFYEFINSIPLTMVIFILVNFNGGLIYRFSCFFV